MYIGNVKDKLTLKVKLSKHFRYERMKYAGYGTEMHDVYIFEDEEGNVLSWDTASTLWRREDEPSEVGDVLEISGTVKAHKEYKGVEQTCLSRVKVITVIHESNERAERAARRAAQIQAQWDSLEEGDTTVRMPYRQYKEHYADCETIIDSYSDETHTILVICRAGRIKNSGVRGEHFSGYTLESETGKKVNYRAVCEENAIKRAVKKYGDLGWKCTKIWHY